MAKAYFINAGYQRIEECEIAHVEDVRKLIGGWLECAYLTNNKEALYVNEDGIRDMPDFGFVFSQRLDQLLYGNGVWVGREIEIPGNGLTWADPVMRLDNLKRHFTFWKR